MRLTRLVSDLPDPILQRTTEEEARIRYRLSPASWHLAQNRESGGACGYTRPQEFIFVIDKHCLGGNMCTPPTCPSAPLLDTFDQPNVIQFIDPLTPENYFARTNRRSIRKRPSKRSTQITEADGRADQDLDDAARAFDSDDMDD